MVMLLKMDDPTFVVGSAHTASVSVPVSPGGLDCMAELFLSSDGGQTKAATSGLVPFTSMGQAQSITLQITMPNIPGTTYSVYLAISAEGQLIQGFVGTDKVTIAAVAAPGTFVIVLKNLPPIPPMPSGWVWPGVPAAGVPGRTADQWTNGYWFMTAIFFLMQGAVTSGVGENPKGEMLSSATTVSEGMQVVFDLNVIKASPYYNGHSGAMAGFIAWVAQGIDGWYNLAPIQSQTFSPVNGGVFIWDMQAGTVTKQ